MRFDYHRDVTPGRMMARLVAALRAALRADRTPPAPPPPVRAVFAPLMTPGQRAEMAAHFIDQFEQTGEAGYFDLACDYQEVI